MKKIIRILLISLMILMTFTVNAVADDDYQTVFEKYFGSFGKPATGPGEINRVVVYVTVPDGVDPAKVNLDSVAYPKSATDPTWYAIGYYPTQQTLPWAQRYFPVITDVNDIKVLLGDVGLSKENISAGGNEYYIKNTLFDTKRMAFDELKYCDDGAALGDNQKVFGGGSCWHLNASIKYYIFKAVCNGTEICNEYVEEGQSLPSLVNPENTSDKHFVKWEYKDWDNAEFNGTTMPKKDITATAVFEDHSFTYEKTENGHKEVCSVCSYAKEEIVHSYNLEGVCVCGDTSYVLTNLKNEVWTLGSVDTIVFSSNANFTKFKEVKVDDETVDSDKYDAYKGSTVVELKPSYLNTLSAGEHSIEVISNDGSCSGKFTVKEKPAAVVPVYVAPKTGID